MLNCLTGIAGESKTMSATVVGNGGKLVAFHRAGYSELSPEHVRVTETWTPSAALLIVRNAWDPNWHATVDGHEAPVLAADYVDQGVPVPAGRHEIVLAYDDPAVGCGLLGSILSLTALLGTAGFLAARSKSRTGQNHPPEAVEEQV